MDRCYALRDKDIHERKDTHGRCGTLPACLIVYWEWYIKREGLGVIKMYEKTQTHHLSRKTLYIPLNGGA